MSEFVPCMFDNIYILAKRTYQMPNFMRKALKLRTNRGEKIIQSFRIFENSTTNDVKSIENSVS
jgi:hypothetical protein